MPVVRDGDVNARIWIRLKEISESLSLLDQLLEGLPKGPIAAPPRLPGSAIYEGLSIVESFRGDLFIWLRIAGGVIEAK